MLGPDRASLVVARPVWGDLAAGDDQAHGAGPYRLLRMCVPQEVSLGSPEAAELT